MKSTVMKSLKNELKEKALEIRRLKFHRPLRFREEYDLWELEMDIRKISRDFRLKHVVYCLLKGRTMEQIEKPREGNELSMSVVEGLLETYRRELDKEFEKLFVCFES